MNGLMIVLGGAAIIGGILAIWSNTKSGKKWIANL
jgi:hypothetical protein